MAMELTESRDEAARPVKRRRHVNQNEGLIFEKSSPGQKGLQTARRSMSPTVDPPRLLGKAARSEDLGRCPK